MIDLIRDAIDVASPAELNALSSSIWRDFGAGRLSDDQAQDLADRIEARRRGPTNQAKKPTRPSIFPVRRRQRSPNLAASRERRNRLAAAAPLPPELARDFISRPSELAVLKVIGEEIRGRGYCDLPIGAIAARAGVSDRTAQTALRTAERLGLVSIEVRPVRGRKNLPNVVRVVSEVWSAWLKGTYRSHRVKSAAAHERTDFKKSSPERSLTSRTAFRPQRFEHGRDRTGTSRPYEGRGQ